MERERGRRNLEPLGDFARRQSVRCMLDEQPVDGETGFLRQGCERQQSV
jgi:hypothetical protein